MDDLQSRLSEVGDAIGHQLSDREREICTVVAELLNRLGSQPDRFDEASIDANFLYRFEPIWCRQVDVIRKMMRESLALDGEGPLPEDEGFALQFHLRVHQDLSVTLGASDIQFRDATGNPRGYRPLKPEVQQAVDEWGNPKTKCSEQEKTQLLVSEALQTTKIWGEIYGLGYAFGLLPARSELDDLSPNEITTAIQRLASWIIFGRTVPQLRWPKTRLTESKVSEGVMRTIRPQADATGRWESLPSGGRQWIEDEKQRKRMGLDTRARTWAIYFLSRRGGGNLTEEVACMLWNEVFPQYAVQLRSYQRQRDSLFVGGTLKNTTK